MDRGPQLDYLRVQRRQIRRERVSAGYWRVWIGDYLLADGTGAGRAWLIATTLRLVLR